MNENILKSALSYIIGFFISGALVLLGVLLMKSTQSGLSMFLPVLAIPILGVYIYDYRSRIGFGMLWFIPIFIIPMILFVIMKQGID
jgi:hypothetical protein